MISDIRNFKIYENESIYIGCYVPGWIGTWNRVVGKAEGKQGTSLLLQKLIHAKPVKMVANILNSWGKG